MVGTVAGPYGGGTMTTPQLPPPSYPPMPRSHGNATTSLVLSIIGLTMVPGLGIIGWIMGSKALEEIDAHPEMGWTNRDHAVIGRLVGIVGTALLGFIVLLVVGYVVFILGLVAIIGTTP